jgi:tetratricopeptide (TPR) repeat protein
VEEEEVGKNRGKKEKKVVEEGPIIGTIPDNGPNPFLLQALGQLEQKTGNLAMAEELYLQALRSRPSHAAAWVALAQLRTKELRQGARAGRVCYQSAENELKRIGAKPNAFVYTAWASMEYKKGREDSIRRARELYRLALDADPRCSTAYLQLGVMESECGNYDRAKECFEKVLKFDQRNSRVIQAYAIMESRRPREDVDSRKVLDLFERALKANSRDSGVYQAYALYVKELGDVDSARDLLRKGTEVDKRHAPAWQAWGVLETQYSTAKIARDVFQQGIWACAQPGGGQSGGRRCARLWQAWGVLEAQEGDHAAARRCFSRALDADPRNVAAVTAWTLMEADLGNCVDARSIFESES